MITLWVPEVYPQSSSPPFRLALERDYPPFASPFASPSPPSSPHLLFLSGRPARRIQSDSDPKRSSACRSSAGCCHGTVQSDLPYPSLMKTTRAPSGRPPLTFSRSSLDSLLAGFLFFFLILDVALLHKQSLAFEIDKLPWWLKRVWFLLQPPLLSSFEERLGGFLKVLLSFLLIYFLQMRLLTPRLLLGGYCMHWSSFRAAYSLGATDCVSGFPPLWRLSYGGLAGPRYLLEKNIWEDSECRLAACSRLLFHSVSQSPGLVKLPCALQSTGMR